jgi:hypothetical protein
MERGAGPPSAEVGSTWNEGDATRQACEPRLRPERRLAPSASAEVRGPLACELNVALRREE